MPMLGVHKQIKRTKKCRLFASLDFSPQFLAHYFGVEAVEFLQSGKWRMNFLFREPVKIIF
ncbi:MAG: hypothetical protein ACI9LM_002241 [Alteromonadaceae bacterium]|jgi:hypothetical protein